MIVSLSRRLLTVIVALSLVCTLIASACPTCEPVVHGAVSVSDTHGDHPLVNDWQAGAEGCDCCESDGCSDSGALPDGLLQRHIPVTPVAVALLPPAAVLPRNLTGAAHPTRDAAPPGRTKLHIQFASFRC